MRDLLRFMEATLLASSTNFNCMAMFPLGRGIAGRRQIPLNFIIKRNPPSWVPAEYPPGRSRGGDDVTFWYCRSSVLDDKYEQRRALSEFQNSISAT